MKILLISHYFFWFSARQDEMHLKRQKLDYQEITPCLKEVSKIWDEMLLTPDRETVQFDSQKLMNCVKQGKRFF